MTTSERIDFAISLATTKFQERQTQYVTAPDLRRFRRKLCAFIYGAKDLVSFCRRFRTDWGENGILFFPRAIHNAQRVDYIVRPEEFTPRDFERLAQKTMSLLLQITEPTDVIGWNSWKDFLKIVENPRLIGSAPILDEAMLLPVPGRGVMAVGSTDDTFLFRLLLIRPKIGRCPQFESPLCKKKFFLKGRRRENCSDQCKHRKGQQKFQNSLIWKEEAKKRLSAGQSKVQIFRALNRQFPELQFDELSGFFKSSSEQRKR